MKRYIFYYLGLFFLFSQASFCAEDSDSEEVEYDESTEEDTSDSDDEEIEEDTDSRQESDDDEIDNESTTSEIQELPANLSTKQQVQFLVNNILGIDGSKPTAFNNSSDNKVKNTSVDNQTKTNNISVSALSAEDNTKNISTVNKNNSSIDSSSHAYIDYEKYLSKNGAVVTSQNDLLVLKNHFDKANKTLNDLINQKNLKIRNRNVNKKSRKRVSKKGTFYGRTITYNGRKYKVKYFGKRKPLKTANYNIRGSYFSNKSRCNCSCCSR